MIRGGPAWAVRWLAHRWRARLTAFVAAVLLVAAGTSTAGAETDAARAARQATALERVALLREGRGVSSGRELTPALRELSLRLESLPDRERRRARAQLARPADLDADPSERWLVPETPPSPLCSAHFCVHWVQATDDAPSLTSADGDLVPDYVETVAAEAEFSYQVENGRLAWRPAPGDGQRGGDSRLDIYLAQLGPSHLFGYASTDPGQSGKRQHSYLVIDNDFHPSEYGAPALDSLRVTLAHEYNHALQFGYDVTADTWQLEATATWMEEKVHPEISDWLRYLRDAPSRPGWRSLTELPLTSHYDPVSGESSVKPYGSAVWNHWLEFRHVAGAALIRRSWEVSDGIARSAPEAYDNAIRAAGGDGFAEEFARFAAVTAEWESSSLPDSGAFPDVERAGTVVPDGAPVRAVLDHTTFALYSVKRPVMGGDLELRASVPAGTDAAIALMARAGPALADPVEIRLATLPGGGDSSVTLENAGAIFAAGGRVTAILANTDTSTAGRGHDDWNWRADAQPLRATVTSVSSPPMVTGRLPLPGARNVPTTAVVKVTLSEPVSGIDPGSFRLVDEGGRRVPAAVSYAPRRAEARLQPLKPLADTTRYTVELDGQIRNAAATPLAGTSWTFATVRRRPSATIASRQRITAGRLERRGVRVRLRSRDPDPLRYVITLRQRRRLVTRASGVLRGRETRHVHLRIGRRAARRLSRARLRVKATFVDPQRNRRARKRTLRIAV